MPSVIPGQCLKGEERLVAIKTPELTGSLSEMQEKLALPGLASFRDRYLVPALDAGFVEMTIPDKPNSRLQKYRLTTGGAHLLSCAHQHPKHHDETPTVVIGPGE